VCMHVCSRHGSHLPCRGQFGSSMICVQTNKEKMCTVTINVAQTQRLLFSFEKKSKSTVGSFKIFITKILGADNVELNQCAKSHF
jgi:hypothetical protein